MSAKRALHNFGKSWPVSHGLSFGLSYSLGLQNAAPPAVLHDFANDRHIVDGVVGTFSDFITFARDSEVNGFVDGPVLNTFAIDQPAFVIDPATGQRLGYRALAGFTNSLLWSRDLSNAVWNTGTLEGLTQDEVGIDDQENTAWTLTDNDVNQTSRAEQNFTVADNTATHSGLFFVKKEDDESSFPACSLDFLGGTAVRFRAMINKKTGAIQAINDASAADVSILGAGEFWRVEIQATNNGTGNTTLRQWMLPAYSATFGTNEAAATGSAVVDYPGVYLNSSIAGPPIETEGSPVSTAADDATEPFPPSLVDGFSASIKFRTPSSFNTNNYVVEIGQGNTDDRVFVAVNETDLRFFATSSADGTIIDEKPLNSLSPDTDYQVDINVESGNYSVSVDGGNTITSAATGIPDLDGATIYYGMRFSKDNILNGTIQSVSLKSPGAV